MGKRFLSAFKVVLFSISFLAIVSSSAFAGVMSMDWTMKRLNYMSGTWYDMLGRPSCVFRGSTLNGNRILGFLNAAGGGGNFGVTMRFSNGDMFAAFHNLSPNPSFYHQYMTIGGATYRRTPNPMYYESVGGIYLGMPSYKVTELYGQPDLYNGYSAGYSKLGLEVNIREGIVWQITIHNYGDRKFDRSGLDANNSMEEYANAYGINNPVKFANSIGYGEYIWLDKLPYSVQLSLFSN